MGLVTHIVRGRTSKRMDINSSIEKIVQVLHKILRLQSTKKGRKYKPFYMKKIFPRKSHTEKTISNFTSSEKSANKNKIQSSFEIVLS